MAQDMFRRVAISITVLWLICVSAWISSMHASTARDHAEFMLFHLHSNFVTVFHSYKFTNEENRVFHCMIKSIDYSIYLILGKRIAHDCEEEWYMWRFQDSELSLLRSDAIDYFRIWKDWLHLECDNCKDSILRDLIERVSESAQKLDQEKTFYDLLATVLLANLICLTVAYILISWYFVLKRERVHMEVLREDDAMSAKITKREDDLRGVSAEVQRQEVQHMENRALLEEQGLELDTIAQARMEWDGDFEKGFTLNRYDYFLKSDASCKIDFTWWRTLYPENKDPAQENYINMTSPFLRAWISRPRAVIDFTTEFTTMVTSTQPQMTTITSTFFGVDLKTEIDVQLEIYPMIEPNFFAIGITRLSEDRPVAISSASSSEPDRDVCKILGSWMSKNEKLLIGPKKVTITSENGTTVKKLVKYNATYYVGAKRITQDSPDILTISSKVFNRVCDGIDEERGYLNVVAPPFPTLNVPLYPSSPGAL